MANIRNIIKNFTSVAEKETGVSINSGSITDDFKCAATHATTITNTVALRSKLDASLKETYMVPSHFVAGPKDVIYLQGQIYNSPAHREGQKYTTYALKSFQMKRHWLTPGGILRVVRSDPTNPSHYLIGKRVGRRNKAKQPSNG